MKPAYRLPLLLLAVASLIAGVAESTFGSEPVPGAQTMVAADASWVPTGSLTEARVSHTATLLLDGRVLVVGGAGISHASTRVGANNTNYLGSAELYDPATGAWTITASLSIPRLGHTATLLADGRVLVVGGETNEYSPGFPRTRIVELYDPATETWALTGSMERGRAGHTATLLRDGRVLVAGGHYARIVETAEVYEPASGRWSPAGKLNFPRHWHTATGLNDGRVLVVGGGDNNFPTDSDAFASAELYDPVANRWSVTAESDAGMFGHTTTLLASGDVLLTGGCFVGPRAQLFDPANETWAAAKPFVTELCEHTATLMPDGSVLFVGGSGAERFDPGTGVWSNAGALATPRYAQTATLLQDGRVLVAGGSGRADGPPYTPFLIGIAELYVPAIFECQKNHYILCDRLRHPFQGR